MNIELLKAALPGLIATRKRFMNESEHNMSLVLSATKLNLPIRVEMHKENLTASMYSYEVWNAVYQLVSLKIAELSSETDIAVAE